MLKDAAAFSPQQKVNAVTKITSKGSNSSDSH